MWNCVSYAGIALVWVLVTACGPETVPVSEAQSVTTSAAQNASAQEMGAQTRGEPIVTTASGLQYTEIVAGTGPAAQPGDIVSVHYTGKLTNGTKFDSSVDRGEPLQFPLGVGRVIKGWDEGIALMKKGGKATLTIPPELAYGARGAGGGNSTQCHLDL